MAVKLSIGLRNHKVVYITDEIPNGLACECTCCSCGETLIAYKHGVKKAPYFGHKPKSECRHSQYALQTALHYAGKELLETAAQIYLPKVEFVDATDPQRYLKARVATETLHEECWITIKKVILEQKDGDIIPDVVVFCENKAGTLRRLLVEIAVTHFVDDFKLQKIRSRKLPTIEIDLSSFRNDWTKEQIQHEVVNAASKKKWIYNPKIESRKAEVSAKRKQEEEAGRQRREEQRQAAEAKFNQYSVDRSYKVIRSDLLPKSCPLRYAAFRKLLESDFVRNNEFLLKIMTEGGWDGEIHHARFGSWRYIFLHGKRVTVYPGDESYSPNLNEQKRNLYGLRKISAELMKSGLWECNGCEHNADYFQHQKEHYEVCIYPKSHWQP